MNEVEKMYENAGIEPHKYCHNCFDNNGNRIEDSRNCPSRKSCINTCDIPEYNFTAEKQLELIKWLAKKYSEVHIKNNMARGFAIGIMGISFNLKRFEEIIAMVMNTFWQGLTEEERKQIKEILSE